MNNDKDLIKAWDILDKLSPNEIMDMKRIPPDRRKTFILCAKQYADIYGTVCFNLDYTKLKKLHEWK